MYWSLHSIVLTLSAVFLGATAWPTVSCTSCRTEARAAEIPIHNPSPTTSDKERTMIPTNKVTPFLMFNDQLEAALEFYTATFPDSRIVSQSRSGKDGPVTSAEFVIGGQQFFGFNGGPHFKFSEAYSMFVDCKDQAEVDLYWNKLLAAGAKPTQCGWINDPFGLSWQIVPRRFMELMADKDKKKVKAVIDAMLQMQKLDVAALERAYQKG